jgi:membrane protease YdiL (CAAX protease family)
MLGPALAAVVMRLLVSREGLRGSLGLLRPRRFYAVAVLAPAAWFGGLVLVYQATGLAAFTWTHRTPVWLSLVVLGLSALALGPVLGLGEEYGWRGYLLPRLLPLGEVRAALLVGAVWGPWHLPVLLAGYDLPGQPPWLAVAVFCASCLAISLAFTRFYRVTGGSALLLGVMHMALNQYGMTLLAPAALPSASPVLFQLTGLAPAAGLALLMAIIYAARGRRRRDEDGRPLQPRFDGTWRDWLR